MKTRSPMYTDADSHGDTYIRDKEFAKSLWNSRIQRNPMIFNKNQSKSICWNEFNPMGCLSFHLLFLASLCVFVIIRVFICINMCICVCICVYLNQQICVFVFVACVGRPGVGFSLAAGFYLCSSSRLQAAPASPPRHITLTHSLDSGNTNTNTNTNENTNSQNPPTRLLIYTLGFSLDNVFD